MTHTHMFSVHVYLGSITVYLHSALLVLKFVQIIFTVAVAPCALLLVFSFFFWQTHCIKLCRFSACCSLVCLLPAPQLHAWITSHVLHANVWTNQPSEHALFKGWFLYNACWHVLTLIPGCHRHKLLTRNQRNEQKMDSCSFSEHIRYDPWHFKMADYRISIEIKLRRS